MNWRCVRLCLVRNATKWYGTVNTQSARTTKEIDFVFVLLVSYKNHSFECLIHFWHNRRRRDVHVFSYIVWRCTLYDVRYAYEVLGAATSYMRISICLCFFSWSRQTATDSLSNTNLLVVFFFGKPLETINIQWSHTKIFETDFIIIIIMHCSKDVILNILFEFCHSRNFRIVNSGQIYIVWQMTRWKRFIIILSFFHQFFFIFSFFIYSFAVVFLYCQWVLFYILLLKEKKTCILSC